MKIKTLVLVSAAVGLGVMGCSSGPPEATAEQKKAFMGGPMPDDFMKKNAAAMAGPGAKMPADVKHEPGK